MGSPWRLDMALDLDMVGLILKRRHNRIKVDLSKEDSRI
jgi:hypothetical protein